MNHRDDARSERSVQAEYALPQDFSLSALTPRQKMAFVIGGIWVIYIILEIFHIFTFLGIVIYPLTHRAVCAGALIIVGLLLKPARRQHPRRNLTFLDSILILWTLAACGYVAWIGPDMANEWHDANWWQMLLAAGFGLALMESVRRTSGPAPVLLALFAFFYFVYSDYFPGFLMSTGFSYPAAVGWMYLSGEGCWGSIIAVAANTLPGFILFGAILTACGASDFFSMLARATLGAYRGGPAKVAILSSMFFGSLSGSVAANVATTGQITIPLMKKTGFSPELAGAVEAVASTGGMFTPPIMGATAFLVADFLGVSYWTVCVAAFLPAVLYYFTLLFQVDSEALRIGAKGEPKESLPRARDVLKKGWYYLPPFLVLVIAMGVLKYSAETSIVYTLITLLLCTSISAESRLTVPRFLKILDSTYKGMSMVVPLCVAVGILVGAMTITGTGANFAAGLADLANNNIYLLLLFAAVASFIMGMGMASIACYLITVTMLAPAIEGSGVEPIAVHFFLFYYCALSFITPPVAVGAFVASGISGGNPNTTGMYSLRMGIAGFLVPWIFVIYPELLFVGPIYKTALVFVMSLAGLAAVSGGWQGYLFVPLSRTGRAFCLVLGFLIFIPLPDMIQTFVSLCTVLTIVYFYWKMKHTNVDKRIMNV